jgi:CCR4-NOT transcription complex subunit 4
MTEVPICNICCDELVSYDLDWYPCPCGYQVCAFCFDQWKDTCPHCYRKYGADAKQRIGAKYKPGQFEWVVDEFYFSGTLVQLYGFPEQLLQTNPSLLLQNQRYLGQYGRILSINHYKAGDAPFTVSNLRYPELPVVIVLFSQRHGAESCILALDSYCMDGCVLSVSFLLNEQCRNYTQYETCSDGNCAKKHSKECDGDTVFTLDEVNRKSPRIYKALSVAKPADYDLYPKRSHGVSILPPPRLLPIANNPFKVRRVLSELTWDPSDTSPFGMDPILSLTEALGLAVKR